MFNLSTILYVLYCNRCWYSILIFNNPQCTLYFHRIVVSVEDCFFTHPVICVKEVNTRKTCTLNKSSMITASSQTQNSRDRKLTTENRYCTAQYRQQYDSKININKNEVSVSLIDFHIPGITCIRFMKIKIFNVIKLTLSYISYK